MQANTIQIGTGLDANGNLLSPGAAEQNYTLTGVGANPIVYYYGTAWVANQATGKWISPSASGSATTAVGISAYTRTISVGASGGVLDGYFSTDNPGQLSVNGSQYVISNAGWPSSDQGTYRSWTHFNTLLLPGLNTVQFQVSNLGGPTGLIVYGTATGVPDGGLTAMLLGGALLGLGAVRRKVS